MFFKFKSCDPSFNNFTKKSYIVWECFANLINYVADLTSSKSIVKYGPNYPSYTT